MNEMKEERKSTKAKTKSKKQKAKKKEKKRREGFNEIRKSHCIIVILSLCIALVC